MQPESRNARSLRGKNGPPAETRLTDPGCRLEFLEGYEKHAGLHRLGDLLREHARVIPTPAMAASMAASSC